MMQIPAHRNTQNPPGQIVTPVTPNVPAPQAQPQPRSIRGYSLSHLARGSVSILNREL